MTRAAAAILLLSAAGAAAASAVALAQDKGKNKANEREEKVRGDRDHVVKQGKWIYDDLAAGVEEGKRAGKPLVVVFRCIPCEACAQLDEDVLNGDPKVDAILDRFVRVRIPKTNGMDLSLFRFDFDQSWTAFMLAPDLTVLGRYGTRSARSEDEKDVTLEGFAAALSRSLELFARLDEVRPALAGKRGAAPEFPSPEKYPALSGKYTESLDYAGRVVPSCIHCHQVGEARRAFHRAAGKGIPEDVLFPFPHPSVLGLSMDPKAAARVAEVAAGSSAASDGFRAGDEIVALAGQPVVSVADLQWVLDRAQPGTSKLDAEVQRGADRVKLALTLPGGWRRSGDLSWRTTSWDLRRMLSGGMFLAAATPEERKAAGAPEDPSRMALRAQHVGQYGDHARAKQAGLQKGDVVTAVRIGKGKPRRDLLTETRWFEALAESTKPGDTLVVTYVRNGKEQEASFATQ
ncbi:MAG: hypothetical protein HMLKMBBP_03422 [Planctomycetes bacterium]|nr:hypothetical protein [Planctomycetota bacterium]